MTNSNRVLGAAAPGADLYLKLAFAAGLFVAGFVVPYLVASSPPMDPFGYLIGRDFVNTWMGARIALTGDPSQWFPHEAYNLALQAQFGADYPFHLWGYPPHLLLMTWPFGLLPYLPAYALWCAIGFAVYLFVTADGERRLDHLAVLALAPAVTVNVLLGQNGFFTAALLIAGLINLDRRPVVAGILFGLLTIKPQLGFLLPLMLLLTGRWRVIFAAAATCAILFGLTALVFGSQIWTAYVDVSMPLQLRNITRGTGPFMPLMPTAFMNMRLAGHALEAAVAVQAVVSVAAIAAVVWTFVRRRDPALSMALLVTATFVAMPYASSYDMVVFGWVLVTLANRADNNVWDYALMLAVWTLPVTTGILGFGGLPVSALVLMGFAARLVWRLRRAGAARSSSGACSERLPGERAVARATQA